MKKLCMILLVMFSVATMSFAESIVKIGADVSGTHNTNGKVNIVGNISTMNSNDSVEVGITPSYEYVFEKSNNMQFGAGVSYQLSRAIEQDMGKINFIPVYGLAKIFVSNSFYLLGHLGYNFFNADDVYKASGFYNTENGIYYGIGAGISQMDSPLIFELLYSVNNGSIKGEENLVYGGYYYSMTSNANIKYSKVSISVGYKFTGL